MASFTVVYDACVLYVLYPALVRDLVVELARTGLMRAKWTEQIQNEWINAICRQRPELDRSRLERTAQLMRSPTYRQVMPLVPRLVPRANR